MRTDEAVGVVDSHGPNDIAQGSESMSGETDRTEEIHGHKRHDECGKGRNIQHVEDASVGKRGEGVTKVYDADLNALATFV